VADAGPRQRCETLPEKHLKEKGLGVCIKWQSVYVPSAGSYTAQYSQQNVKSKQTKKQKQEHICNSCYIIDK
jgi:hypothetical protein